MSGTCRPESGRRHRPRPGIKQTARSDGNELQSNGNVDDCRNVMIAANGQGATEAETQVAATPSCKYRAGPGRRCQGHRRLIVVAVRTRSSTVDVSLVPVSCDP